MTAGDGARGRRDATGYLFEGLTIVAGILMALLLDAGWDWARDRRDEAQYLTGLRQELEASDTELALDREARRTILARTGALLQHADEGTAVPADSVSLYLEAVMDFRFFTPVRTVMDDLLASGGMTLIRSEEVRRGLLGYAQEMERLQVVEGRERDFAADHVEPWMTRYLPVAALVAREEGGEVERIVPAAVASLNRALADPTFTGLVHLRWRRTDLALRFATGVERWIGYALEALE